MQQADSKNELERYRAEQEHNIGVLREHHIGKIDATMIRRYALAINDDNPIYHDSEAARRAGFDDIVAPPNFLSAVVEWGAGKPESELSADGTSRGSGSTLKVMGAGERIEALNMLVAGMEVYSIQSVEAVQLKQGKSGPLLFITGRHDFYETSGLPLNRNRRTIMVRS